MLTPPFRAPRFFLSPAFPVAIIVVASAIGLSAHVIKSVDNRVLLRLQHEFAGPRQP
jgi:hypothetical protein